MRVVEGEKFNNLPTVQLLGIMSFYIFPIGGDEKETSEVRASIHMHKANCGPDLRSGWPSGNCQIIRFWTERYFMYVE